MTPDEYLDQVLGSQRLTQDELDELRRHRADVEKVLEDHFAESSPTIQYAGSYKKETMIRASYDLDIACYFPHDDDDAGDGLSDIFDSAYGALAAHYDVEKKTSALRLREKGAVISRRDFRIDVVPGRFTDEANTDVFLHQNGGGKARLKTNLQTHVEHIRDSGVRDAIKLLKLWKYQRRVRIKTFVLELLVIKLLKGRKDADLSKQLAHIFTVLRDDVESLSVQDPANSNNDLKPLLDEARGDISAWAATTMGYIDKDRWEDVFGKVPEKAAAASVTAAIAKAAALTAPVRPWNPEK
jgi:Second Messenger Oligonucleotide or Dinucleotide Synthetase domain